MSILSSWMNTAHSVLLHGLTERMENNQSDLFTEGENLTQKALAVGASVASIVFCLLSIYMFSAIDPKRLVFRHQLIAFLIFFDLLKATVLLIFPARVMADSASYASNTFCQVVGFFTATAIEGADLAILAFAIHTFLLIFKPSLTVKIKGSGHAEGGLYRYRYLVYGLSFVIPLAMASFPYIGKGYNSFVCWCYLPQQPFWYRTALSWGPRYVIVIVIFTVYVSIYIHVLREFRLLGGAFTHMHHQKLGGAQKHGQAAKPSFFSAFVFFWRDLKMFFFPQFVSTGSRSSTGATNSTASESNSNPASSNPESSNDESKDESPGGPLDIENNLGEAEFRAANLASFKKRQKTIEKQMKSIFIYPIAYISIWLFPFVLHCTQFTYEQTHGPVVWLNCLSAFVQPFIGVVDSLVFFYREQPWKYTIMRNFEKENASKLDQMLLSGPSLRDSESITTSAKLTRSSVALSMHVDMAQYSRWRRFMSRCRFPLMQLPSEDNIARFQAEHFKRKMQLMRENHHGADLDADDSHLQSGELHGLRAKHDFSNLLSGADDDFAHRIDKHSLSFQDDSIKNSISSGMGSGMGSGTGSGKGRRASVASISNKSARSRRVSVFEGQAPIPENDHYMVGSIKPTKQIPRKSFQTVDSVGEDEELDLLDFLGRGPK